MRRQKGLFAVCCILSTLLAGCGSSSSHSIPAGKTVSGVFVDAPVVGLSFSCGSTTGVTGTGGAFTCPAGSSVTFSVGGITLCTAPAQAFMTPLSCAQVTNPTANTATASVYGVTQLLMSINTTPATPLTTITITSSELQAAKSLTLDFSSATLQTDLLNAVTAIDPGATLVTPAEAQTEITGTVLGALAGKFAGAYGGSDTGTWSVTIASDGTVAGTATNSKGTVTVSGALTSGTSYSGTAGSATWTGTVDSSKAPAVFSGTWDDGGGVNGTFTGTKQ